MEATAVLSRNLFRLLLKRGSFINLGLVNSGQFLLQLQVIGLSRLLQFPFFILFLLEALNLLFLCLDAKHFHQVVFLYLLSIQNALLPPASIQENRLKKQKVDNGSVG